MKYLNYFMLVSLMLLASSCTDQEDGQYIPGIDGPQVNIQNGKVLVSVELVNINPDLTTTLPVPKMDNTDITLGAGPKGGTQIQVSFDLNDVESDEFQVVPPEVLPDGRPFPFMVEGTLPAIAIHVPRSKDMTYYVSTKVFGFFLPLKVPADFQDDINYRIRINDKNYGIVSLIHPDEHGEGSGVVVLLTLDEIRDNPDARKLLKLSKKYKNRVF